MKIKRIGVSVIMAALVFSCASDQPVSHEKNNTRYYSEFGFDQYGIPVLSLEIEQSAVADASYFYLVTFTDKKPEDIYVIQKTAQNGDYLKPLKIIYEWTGKGFKYGYEHSKGIIETSAGIGKNLAEPVHDANLRVPLIMVTAVPGYLVGTTIFVASGVTGFIIGVKESGPEAYKEIKKTGKAEGLVLGKYHFKYDELNRLAKYIHYSSAPEEMILSETTLYYFKDNLLPYKSINYSHVDRKESVIFEKKD